MILTLGKSGTGKDTLYKKLLSDGALPFERLVPCTTRPIRAGEENGREYHFYSVEEFQAMEAAGRVIESRCYETIHGPWYYFTADDGQIDLTGRSTLLIGTLESYQALRDYYDYRLFVTASPETQRARLRAREGERFAVFEALWIPLEERYFRAFSIEERADYVLRTDG